MSSINVSSLTSSAYGSFDWQTMVDKLIAADSTPVTTLQTTETTNKSKISSLSTLETDLTNLQTSTKALSDSTLFTSRSTTLSNANWTATAANSAAMGTYSVAVTRLATAAHRVGSGDIASGLNTSDDVSGLTLATLPTATAVTAGAFTVDGKTVSIALTDSLQDVFTKINLATSNKVTASYNHLTDKITLANTNPLDTDEIALGAVNDSSNFLQAMHLANNGATSVSSSTSLGAAALSVPLSQARLRTAITAVDPSHNGSFTINGTSISYNLDTDSLSTVLARINASAAGVTAKYDTTNDRVVLTNNSTGDIGLGANEATGGLLGALGLTSGSTLVHGLNAQVSVNGGSVVSSTSNTFDESVLGISGLTLTATSATTESVNVATNSTAIKTSIQNFIDQYNTVQSYIADQTAITIGTDGKVQTALLSDNHDISTWADDLRSRAFATVSGLSGTIKQLSNLGLDFDSSGQLSVKDSSTLDAALTNHSSDVAAFFTTATTGFSAKVNSYLDSLLSATGGLATANDALVADDNSIETQITALQSALDRERETLTTAFEAMQSAQTLAQSQTQYLNAMYYNKSSNNS